MNSIARSSLSSLLYLLLVVVVTKLVADRYPNADLANLTKLVFLIPALSVALWHGWLAYETDSRRVRLRAFIAMLFWSALPPFFAQAVNIDTHWGSTIIFFSLVFVTASFVAMIVTPIGGAIIPWLMLAVTIHGLTFYFCLVDPTHLAPVYVALQGLAEAAVLYLIAKFQFPRVLDFSTLLPRRRVLHRHHPFSVIPRLPHV